MWFAVGAIAAALFVVYIAAILYWRGIQRKGEAPLAWTWVPFVGGGIEMMSKPYEFFRRHFAKYGDAFTIVLGGNRVLFTRDPLAWTAIYKNHKVFNFEETIADFIGVAFGAPEAHLVRFDAEMARKIHTRYILGAEALDDLTASFQRELSKDLLARLPADFQEVDFYDFCLVSVLRASVTAFFNESLSTDQCIDAFKKFDAKFVRIMGGRLVPKSVVAEALTCRAMLTQRMVELIQNDSAMATCAPHIQQLTSHNMKTLTVEEHAGHLVAIMWAANANTVPAVFWTVYKALLAGGEALAAIRKELAEVTQKAAERQGVEVGPHVQFTRQDLDSMKVLDSAVWETLRLLMHMSAGRKVMQDTELPLPMSGGAVKLRKGDRVMMPAFLVHHDAEIYPDPFVWKYDRFLPGPDGKPPVFSRGGHVIPNYLVPFGGGINMCPGRSFAVNEMKLLSAVILQFCDLELLSKEVEPDIGRVMMSVLPPKAEVPARIRLRA